jgi:hypothetical protein
VVAAEVNTTVAEWRVAKVKQRIDRRDRDYHTRALACPGHEDVILISVSLSG